LQPLWLLRFNEKSYRLFQARQAQLQALWRQVYDLGSYDRCAALEALLKKSPPADPFVRMACSEAFLASAIEAGLPLPEVMDLLQREPSLTARQLGFLAATLENADPKLALSFAKQALRIRPDFILARAITRQLSR